MPVNEILAPFYLKMRYQTPQSPHSIRCYFEQGSVLGNPPPLSPNDWTIQGASSLVATSISDVAFEIFNRASSGLPAGTVLTEIAIWQGLPGVNGFVGQNSLPATNTFGSGAGIAAAYTMLVFGSATRQLFKFNFYDSLDARPQRYPGANPPLVDNGSFEWYILKGNVPFATQDGLRLRSYRTYHTGYNRKLARSYGRVLQP